MFVFHLQRKKKITELNDKIEEVNKKKQLLTDALTKAKKGREDNVS